MSFSEILKKVVEDADHAIGAAVVANDGIVVEEYKKDPSIDLYVLGAEFCKTFKEFKEKTDFLQKGSPVEFSVLTESLILIFKKINNDHFLILVLESEGNFGKGRFLIKREMGQLITEFQ
ncbi:MAG: roadblock/LC7 domain-containing protein [Nitrospirae bacterium]|nr:roadblock/LC7 domain-containing protein [Nitrospirota bacterium]MBI3352558.1 roadblock/LC7 domain-containing protein [Nitrospirota bacterium]